MRQEEGKAPGSSIAEEHADLAVFDTSDGAAVLAGDAAGMLAFLEEAALIKDQDAIGDPQVLNDVGP